LLYSIFFNIMFTHTPPAPRQPPNDLFMMENTSDQFTCFIGNYT
jgi:hypothetical protein